MTDETPEAAAAASEAPARAETPPAAALEAVPSQTDALVDRWFADYAIPNYFSAAKAELKKRLNQDA